MKYLIPLFTLLLLASLTACSGDQPQKDSQEETTAISENNSSSEANETPTPNDMTAAMEQAQKALDQMSSGQATEPVNFRELQTVLPEELGGLEQTDKSGQTTGSFGYKISQTSGKYESSDGKMVEVDVIDTGGFAAGLMGMAAWANVTIDKEDSNGFERSTTINGYKGFEKYTKSNNRSEISLLVEERFVVKVEGRNMSMDELRDLVDDLNLNGLAGLGK